MIFSLKPIFINNSNVAAPSETFYDSVPHVFLSRIIYLVKNVCLSTAWACDLCVYRLFLTEVPYPSSPKWLCQRWQIVGWLSFNVDWLLADCRSTLTHSTKHRPTIIKSSREHIQLFILHVKSNINETALPREWSKIYLLLVCLDINVASYRI